MVIKVGHARLVVTMVTAGLVLAAGMAPPRVEGQPAAGRSTDAALEEDPFAEPPPRRPTTPAPIPNLAEESTDFEPLPEFQSRPNRPRPRDPSSKTTGEPDPALPAIDPAELETRQLGRQNMARPDAPPDTPASTDGGATLNLALVERVRDNTLGLQPEDRPAYFYALWLCEQLAPDVISRYAAEFRAQRQALYPKYANRPAAEFPVFVDVFQHPIEYRGRPVSMQGYFRKLVKYDPGPNDLGVKEVYEGWFYSDDSQTNPAVVIFTGKPEGLLIGGDITEEVRFSGYFLKLYGYDAQDTTRRAPLFLAGDVQWFPARAANDWPLVPVWAYVVLTFAVIGAIWWLYQTNSEDRKLRQQSMRTAIGRDFDEFPPQEFLPADEDRPLPKIDPQH
jgi:hypothetical protein